MDSFSFTEFLRGLARELIPLQATLLLMHGLGYMFTAQCVHVVVRYPVRPTIDQAVAGIRSLVG